MIIKPVAVSDGLLFFGCMANVGGKFWDSKGTTVPLAGGLEDSVLQGFKILPENAGGEQKTVR